MVAIILAGLAGLILGAMLYHIKVQQWQLEFRLLQEKYTLQEQYHQQAGAQLELKLKDISREIIEEKTRRFREDSLKGLELMLNPFRERMLEFQQKVEEMHLTDTKDRLKLQSEIERIVSTGQRMSVETENLTRALKGDVKLQGSWGEMILERVLEASGLRAGEEFTLQGKELQLKDDQGRHQMPDVIINLPDNKHLIIDSKVSLLAYERYVNQHQQEDLTLFLNSLYAHIKGLAAKKYQNLERLISPDYVMLFIPIEGAFMLAMQKDKELLSYAWDQNIVLVGPSTLLATLRTVASLWKQERQTKNALEIARQAGALYDKFVGVTQDLDQMELQLKRLAESVSSIKGKMLTGKGSVASRMENLRELGAKTTKSLPPDLS
jgi:DNA recombination protein RmuC